jgi:hypothetical protein
VSKVAQDQRGAEARRLPGPGALAWLLARPAVTSVVIGVRTTEQLADNLGRPVPLRGLLYPYWQQAKTAADRLGPAELALFGPHLAG